MMIPDTQRRLGDALQELKSMLVRLPTAVAGDLLSGMCVGQVQQREGASEEDVKAAEEAIENASV